MNFIQDTVEANPTIATTEVIGKTSEGKDLRVITLTGNANNNKHIWIGFKIFIFKFSLKNYIWYENYIGKRICVITQTCVYQT